MSASTAATHHHRREPRFETATGGLSSSISARLAMTRSGVVCGQAAATDGLADRPDGSEGRQAPGGVLRLRPSCETRHQIRSGASREERRSSLPRRSLIPNLMSPNPLPSSHLTPSPSPGPADVADGAVVVVTGDVAAHVDSVMTLSSRVTAPF